MNTATLSQAIQNLVRAQSHNSKAALSVSLFQTLGWNGDGYDLVQYQAVDKGITYRMDVDGETTALLLVASQIPAISTEGEAANIAYNTGIDWVAVSDFSTTKLIHSRWSENPVCFSLQAEEYTKHLEQLSLLSPQAIIDGRLAAHARRVELERPRQVLLPIDEELISRLSRWRQLLLSQSQNVTDEQIHELFGRLFFVRSCEDRSILPNRPLHRIIQSPTEAPLLQQLASLFRQLSVEFNSELFVDPEGVLPSFEPSVLFRIVQELYEPFPGLPQYQYNFAHLTVDILGKVYEQYVSYMLMQIEPQAQPSQLRLFAESQEVQVEQVTQRRERGVFFTPPYLVNYIVQQTLEKLLSETTSVSELPRVADISCGSGAFLSNVASKLTKRAQELSPESEATNWTHNVLSRVLGVDIDARAVTLARVNLWTLVTTQQPARPLPELSNAIFADDALLSPKLDQLREHFDVVVGNPPYRSARDIQPTYQDSLRRRYGSAQGRYDLAYVFLERAIQLVRPGGYIGLVLPNRIFGNSNAKFIRDIVTQHCQIEKVVDFGHISVFPEGDSYICILILRKLTTTQSFTSSEEVLNRPEVSVHRILQAGNFMGLQLRRPDLFYGQTQGQPTSETTRVSHPVGDGPWIWLSTGINSQIRQKLQSDAVDLQRVAILSQGIKTGDNNVFILTRQKTNPLNGKWLMTNGLGQAIELEPDFLRPCTGGASIRRYALIVDSNSPSGSVYLLYPYRDGQLVPEHELAAIAPDTYTYLQGHRTRLSRRENVLKGGAWYDISRSRAAGGWIDQPKILSRMLITEPSFAYDEQGVWIPVGGVALLPRDSTVLPPYLMLGVLNSAVMTWYLLNAQVARRQGGYFELAQRELKRFPFPLASISTEPALANRIAALAYTITRSVRIGHRADDASEEINEILFDLLGLNSEERRVIRGDITSTLREERNAFSFTENRSSLLDVDVEIMRLIQQSEPANTEKILLDLRDMIMQVLRDEEKSLSTVTKSLLTFAVLAMQQLSRGRPTTMQFSVIRSLIQICTNNPTDPMLVGRFERQLRASGIDILMSIPNAGEKLALHPDDAENDSATGG